jgi:hypothetical protein
MKKQFRIQMKICERVPDNNNKKAVEIKVSTAFLLLLNIKI